MQLELGPCVVRGWQRSDAEALAHNANSRAVWRNLRDAFPHPYTLADAEAFLDLVEGMNAPTLFAIDVDGEAVGGIGYGFRVDVERISAEIGYWLAEGFWGRGITTAALRAVTAHAFTHHGLLRVFAMPFEWNTASIRVLEKAGYQLEGRMRKSAIKDGVVIDQLLYAAVHDEWPDAHPGARG